MCLNKLEGGGEWEEQDFEVGAKSKVPHNCKKGERGGNLHK